MAESPQNLPGHGFLGWLGRQVGYITKAVKTDVAPPLQPAEPLPEPRAEDPAEPRVVYRTDTVEQMPHPTEPGVLLRRTTVDEVVVTDNRGEGDDRGSKTST